MWVFLLRAFAFFKKLMHIARFNFIYKFIRKIRGLPAHSKVFRLLGTSKYKLISRFSKKGAFNIFVKKLKNNVTPDKQLSGKTLNKVLSDSKGKGKEGRYINSVFISSWTQYGIYDNKKGSAILYHKGVPYHYPQWDKDWFKTMQAAFSPDGYGAGTVWWAFYKNHAKAMERTQAILVRKRRIYG